VVNILALLSENVPSKSRATLVGLVASGVSVGGLLGPLVGLWAYPRFGWRSFFLISSVMIVLVPLFARWLPEASSQLARTGQWQRLLAYLRRARPQTPLADNVDIEVEQGRDRVPLSEVFKDGRRRGALLFWLCYLMNMYVIYGFSFWLQKLMITPFRSAITQFDTNFTNRHPCLKGLAPTDATDCRAVAPQARAHITAAIEEAASEGSWLLSGASRKRQCARSIAFSRSSWRSSPSTFRRWAFSPRLSICRLSCVTRPPRIPPCRPSGWVTTGRPTFR
jgi:hypothetical protein